MPLDPKVTDILKKPAKRVIVEYADGTCIVVEEGNIQRQELFAVHANMGLLALTLAVSTIGWQSTPAASVLIHPTPVLENVRDERHIAVHAARADKPAGDAVEPGSDELHSA